MAEISSKEIQGLMSKYSSKLKSELDIPEQKTPTAKDLVSREYKEFKKEILPPQLTLYEQLCNFSEKILKVKPDKKKEAELEESLKACHLNVTPTGTTSFSLLFPILLILVGSVVSYFVFGSFFFVFFFLMTGVVIMTPLGKIPYYLANSWRMKGSNQMVQCIFYIVTYMRHTSNLEKAVDFAAEHLSPPLSLDLKKVLWDVETGEYDSIKESLDMYLERWRKYNLEFIEAFHLIESSLYEGVEERRVAMLDKSLEVMLDETYEKMLHYTHNLQSPIAMLNMLGIILPILGLVILPLVVSFMEGVRWFHIATLYNVILPISVYYMGKNILSTRPTGYGSTEISTKQQESMGIESHSIKLGKIKIPMSALYISFIIGTVLLIIGLSPIILGFITPEEVLLNEEPIFGSFKLLGYKLSSTSSGPLAGKVIGPYGFGASILSICVPLGIGLAIGLYFKLKSKDTMKIREESKKLESEFASALFQLGNRLGDGLPAELAIGRVSATMEGTSSGNFFRIVSTNIRKLGSGIEGAIFDPRVGAIKYFPSNLIESSMKVLVQSIRKGPSIASQALMNVSKYIKTIHKVNERLKDLMAEVIASMESQIKFLTPVISGIVIGLTSMITSILSKLGAQMKQVGAQAGAQAASLSTMFGDGLPTFHFQIVVGIYVVQIIYILTFLVNGIENGSDKVNERFLMGQNITRSILLYTTVALIVMVLFNFIASQIMTATISVG